MPFSPPPLLEDKDLKYPCLSPRTWAFWQKRIEVVNSATRGDVDEAMKLLFLIDNRDYTKPLPTMKRTGPLD